MELPVPSEEELLADHLQVVIVHPPEAGGAVLHMWGADAAAVVEVAVRVDGAGAAATQDFVWIFKNDGC